jgi:hypothetical protein
MQVEIDDEVRALGERIGYGALMQQAQEAWRQLLVRELGFSGGEFAIGPCVALMVPCPHTVKDGNGHCEICCGSGRTTKWVAQLLAELK